MLFRSATAAMMSITGLAARPGTAVLPKCSIGPDSHLPSAASSSARSSWNKDGQAGSYETISTLASPLGLLVVIAESASDYPTVRDTDLEIVANVAHVANAIRVLVDGVGEPDHLSRDVDADDPLEMRGQRLAEPSDAAPEVEGGAPVDGEPSARS